MSEVERLKLILDIFRGAVIGLANLISGVSGGTMMVSMGVYDTLIHCITHLFSQFKQSVKTLLPYAVGMALAIIVGAIGLKTAFRLVPLPTNLLFVGLIVGSVPMILKQMKGEKTGVIGALCFLTLFALVIVLKLIEKEHEVAITLSFGEVIKLFLLGGLASGTMVIPGMSGSMLLKTLGYYEPIVTGAIPDAMSALSHGDFALLMSKMGLLVPFGLGIVVGIFAIAKPIEVLLHKWKGYTYCAILGMVAASPIVILMDGSLYTGYDVLRGILTAAAGVLALALGVMVALELGGGKEEAAK